MSDASAVVLMSENASALVEKIETAAVVVMSETGAVIGSCQKLLMF